MSLISILLLSCQDKLMVPQGTVMHNAGNEDTEQQDTKEKVSSYDEFTPVHIYEIEIWEHINEYRAQMSLSPLELHPLLIDVAREHSMKMAYGDVPFGHDGFEDRVSIFLDRFSYTTYRAAENVAQASGESAPDITVDMWLDSEGHRENIEGPYSLTGIGAFERDGTVYFTQIFFDYE